MAQEALVQVAADGAGKKIRNLSAYVPQSDGTVSLVHMQVVALVREDGSLLNLDIHDLLENLLRVARQQRFLLNLLVGEAMETGTISRKDISTAGDDIL